MPARLERDPGDAPLIEPGSPAEFARAFRLPPEEAVRYMQGRARVRVTYDWHELWQDEHARAFTVSRLTRADLLNALRERIERSVAGDLSRRDFLRDARAMLADAGWWGVKRVATPDGRLVETRFTPARLRLIYEVNSRMAHAAGRWERIQAAQQTHPFLRYVTRMDERVRQSHRPWHDVTLPVDNPWWRTHYPPNGWRCRCTVVAMRAAEVERRPELKRASPDEPTVVWQNPLTGEKRAVPFAIDPGFNYNVGGAAARWRGLVEAARDKLARYEADLGVRAGAEMAALVERDWAEWIEPLLAHPTGEPLKTNRPGWLGAISALDLAHLRQAGIAPVSAEVMLRPGIVAGPKAARHARDGNALSAEQWRTLPALWRQAAALLLDVKSGKPLWILPGLDGRATQLAVEVDFVTRRPKRTINAAMSAYNAKAEDLRGRIRGGELKLLWGNIE